ncbi:DUF6387 family protein [Paraburkholderia kirstenboschensis]|uniref:DUF6387 family protein n=1 Tax=Paraburkholderia kirstenboschensis TaxID=1245436 RepID=A0ABZ0ERF9_9BURK|nr:DUF6387 family protein [Paraburkholderia kirstenboschensis]WOD18962.1 DUF6387 family protein [Paraburkholderia kirstenboschensis]
MPYPVGAAPQQGFAVGQAMKKLEFGVSDIPASFQLERYAGCANWGAPEWWRALSLRYPFEAWSYLTPEELAEDEDNPDLLEIVRGNVLGFMERPLPVVEGELRPFPADTLSKPIRDLTGADYYEGLFNLHSGWYDKPSTLALRAIHRAGMMDFEAIQPEQEGERAFAELSNTPAWRIHREADAPAEKFGIEVNLGATDEFLVKEFKRWLKRIRKDAGIPQIPKEFDASHFADWHEDRLLPYLDLTMWARSHGGAFNLSALGYVLFPDEALRDAKMREVEPRIRRTIAPKARAIISLEVISTLNRQVWVKA